jgi:coatomer protein complex subunit epsilon
LGHTIPPPFLFCQITSVEASDPTVRDSPQLVAVTLYDLSEPRVLIIAVKMDPFSGEGELLNLTTAFYTHAYSTVLDFDTSALSASNKSAAQILKYRAQIGLGQASAVISSLKSTKDPASKSILALAQHATGDPKGLEAATSLAESEGEDGTVQICAGTVLASAGEYATAIELLQKHQGSLEAVAILVQIHLAQNRTDLALKEVAAAKRWANDSLLINMAESWTNLRVGGSEKYQSSFYVYEELATTPGTTSPTALVGQAVSEMHLGRWEEAQLALDQAIGMDGASVESIANSLVLASITGKKGEIVQDLMQNLKQKNPHHPLLQDLDEKSTLFDTAAQKYSAKAAS